MLRPITPLTIALLFLLASPVMADDSSDKKDQNSHTIRMSDQMSDKDVIAIDFAGTRFYVEEGGEIHRLIQSVEEVLYTLKSSWIALKETGDGPSARVYKTLLDFGFFVKEHWVDHGSLSYENLSEFWQDWHKSLEGKKAFDAFDEEDQAFLDTFEQLSGKLVETLQDLADHFGSHKAFSMIIFILSEDNYEFHIRSESSSD